MWYFMFLENIIQLDIAAIIIMLLLIGSIIMKKLYTLGSSRIFVFIIIITMLTTIFDILSVVFFNEPYPLENVYKNIGITFNTLYYIFRNLMIFLFAIYLLQLTDSMKKILKSPLLSIILFLPIIIVIGLIISNPFTHLIFDVEIENDRFEYVTGTLFFVPYVITVVYFVIGFINIFKYSYYFTRYQIIALVSIAPITIISLILQFILTKTNIVQNNILLEMFTSVLSMILITTSIETALELIDNKTSFLSFKQFNKILKRTINTKSDLNIIIIKISNYSDIYNKLSYEMAENYVKNLANVIKKKAKTLKGKVFYIDEGLYSIVVDKEVEIKSFAQIIDTLIVNFNENNIVPTSRLCVISLPEDFDDLEQFVKFIRNYYNKFKFNNNIVYYSELSKDREFKIKNDIDIILDNAFNNKSFEVYYQPIYDIRKKSFTKIEALVRLNDKDYGFIEPFYFIKYAELANKIDKIDLFVIEEAIKFIASPQFKELKLESININISISECVNLTLYNNVVKLIDFYKIDPSHLNLEVVEGNDLLNHEAIYNTILEFKKIGIHFALDNYGIGYSNIANFSKTPLSTVKIDKVLFENINEVGVDSILNNTIDLIRSLGRKIVFEGVETKEKQEMLSKYDCDYVQGFYYSKPIKKEELIEFLRKNNR